MWLHCCRHRGPRCDGCPLFHFNLSCLSPSVRSSSARWPGLGQTPPPLLPCSWSSTERGQYGTVRAVLRFTTCLGTTSYSTGIAQCHLAAREAEASSRPGQRQSASAADCRVHPATLPSCLINPAPHNRCDCPCVGLAPSAVPMLQYMHRYLGSSGPWPARDVLTLPSHSPLDIGPDHPVFSLIPAPYSLIPTRLRRVATRSNRHWVSRHRGALCEQYCTVRPQCQSPLPAPATPSATFPGVTVSDEAVFSGCPLRQSMRSSTWVRACALTDREHDGTMSCVVGQTGQRGP